MLQKITSIAMESHTEKQYLNGMQDGDHKAFSALFMIYYPKMKFYLTRFLKDDNEASDMAQDIFYKIWENRENCCNIKNFNAYIYSMARNAVYNYFEHNLIKQNYASKFQEGALYNDILEGELYAKELGLLIDIAIEKMPEQRRRIFKMSRKEGLSNEDISKELFINKRTVENHITLALADLRKIIILIPAVFLFL